MGRFGLTPFERISIWLGKVRGRLNCLRGRHRFKMAVRGCLYCGRPFLSREAKKEGF